MPTIIALIALGLRPLACSFANLSFVASIAAASTPFKFYHVLHLQQLDRILVQQNSVPTLTFLLS